MEMSHDEVRRKAEEIVDRLKSDPAFRRRVEADPSGALQAAGLPEQLLTDFVAGFGKGADVEAHELQARCEWTCTRQTSECTKSYLV
jgi:hypothetical protein